MNDMRVRAAVSPLRRRFPDAATPLPSVDELIAAERPEEPMHCLRPAVVEASARDFAEVFPSDVTLRGESQSGAGDAACRPRRRRDAF